MSNYPQTVSTAGAIQGILTPEQFNAFLEGQTPTQQAWLTTGGPNGGPGIYSVRQFQDAPGGKIKGYELAYQQDLTFLPSFLKHLGVIANYTHLSSELAYILDPGSTVAPIAPQITAPGPFLGASPNAANVTLYYETRQWSARVSLAYRKGYVTTYPLAAGTCAPGACDSPLVNDFLGSESTKNYDASVTYNLTDHVTFSLEGLNLTNQTENRWAYQNEPLVTQYSSSGRQYFMGLRYQL